MLSIHHHNSIAPLYDHMRCICGVVMLSDVDLYTNEMACDLQDNKGSESGFLYCMHAIKTDSLVEKLRTRQLKTYTEKQHH